MKTYKFFLAIAFFAFGTTLIAQNAAEKQNEKSDKKIVIIKKTTDENGNEIVEKIIKEGDGEDSNIWISKDGEEMKFPNDFEFEFKELGDDLKIFGDDLDQIDVLKLDLDNLENLDEEIQERMKNMNVEIKELEDGKAVWIYGDENGEPFNFEFDFDDIPADIMKELEEKGINLKNIDNDLKNGFHFNTGHDNKAFLGVKIGSVVDVENVNGEVTETVEGKSEKGAEIIGTIEGSAAESAGLLKGDIITAIDGKITKDHETLVEILGDYKVGDKIAIDYLRDGKSMKTEATLTENKNAGKMNFWMDTDHEDIDMDSDGNVFFFDSSDENGEKIKKSKSIYIIKKSDDGQESFELKVEEDTDEPTEELEFNESQELDLDMVNIFPNPTNGLVQVQFKGEAVPTVIRVSDITGKEVYQESLNNFNGNYNAQVDVSRAAKGTLLLSVTQGKKTFTEKIILE
jgi:hypothetical protein